MAIRMKEWGMQQLPAPSVKIPTQGLLGWGDVAADLGRGMGSVLSGLAEFANERDRVTAGGELAAFSAQLRKIGDETARELSTREVADWDYAWEELSAPRFAEAVAGLSPVGRKAGAELAAAYSMRASVMARRDKELARIQTARRNWQQRVDAAVSEGDEQRADSWLQSGTEVFVPAAEVEQARATVRSRARSARWRNALEQDTVATLAALRTVPEDELPQAPADRRELSSAAEHAYGRARQEYARVLCAAILEGREPDARQAEAAQRAGLVSATQVAGLQAAPHELSTAQFCDRMRRIDECAAQGDARADMVLDIATAAIPLSQRVALLQRAELAAGVPEAERRMMSAHLFRMYRRGVFGSPGDSAADAQLCHYQQQGLELLAREGAQPAARWLAELDTPGGAWVCFADLNA